MQKLYDLNLLDTVYSVYNLCDLEVLRTLIEPSLS